MEKWRSKGKGMTKEESILPPTRRPSSQNCLPIDKKKDRKWSFGGFLRRISHGQHNEPSSNDEDITYIPGHMLSEKKTKRVSKMKSRLGKMPCRTSLSIEQSGIAMVNEHHNGNKDTSELTGGSRDNIDRSQDSICACNDSIHSQSSEGSSDLLGRINRINRVKARAQAKRDRLRGNSSSEDDSHRSSQSSMRLRSEDNIQNVHRVDSCNRRTRGARTERYIKRMFRDDGTSNSDTKLLKPNDALSRFGNLTASQCSSNSVDCNIWRTNDAMKISAPSCSSPCVVRSHGSINGEKSLPGPIENCYEPSKISKRYLRDMNENVTLEREKLTWPKSNSRRYYPANEIYGSLRPRQGTIDSEQLKVLPPDPPPRSSKSRVFTNVYNVHFPFNNVNPGASQSCRRYYQQPTETNNTRSYNSDNEVVLSEYVAPTRLRHFWKNCDEPKESREIQATPCCSPLCYRTDNHNSENRVKTTTYSSSANRKNRDNQEDQENRDPRPYFENSIRPSNNYIRSTCSLPKGVQLFSRQRLANSGDNETTFEASESSQSMNSKPLANRTMPDSQSFHDQQSPSSRSSIILNEDEAKRKRSSKNLEDALCELEAIYNSLRLSDEDLLERAEQRSMEEYRINAAKKSTGEHSFKSCSDTSSNEKDDNFHDGIKFASSQRETDLRMKDDMAYRRMNPKERPSSVNGQASLAQISYLATSPNLSIRDSDYFEHTPRSRRGTPDLTRDDLLFRSISHANNSLKVIEPQPPFGIPLGPVSGTTESDYLHAKPTKYGQTRSLYIPKTEPDVVCDDLAFRNLRKDMTKDTSLALNKNTNLFIQMDSLNEPSLSPKNTFTFGTRKKRAVRSHSADLYGVTSQNTNKHQYDWYDDYVRSTKKASFATNDVDRSSGMGKCNLNRSSFKNNDANSLNMEQRTSETTRFTNNADVDINGNRPKSALHGKIQVYVPQESGSFADGKRLSEIDTSYKADSTKSMGITESEDSSPERCDSRQSSAYEFPVVDNQCIEQFTELEISEYQQLCQDLEKLIQRTADEETKQDEEARDENEVERNSENSQSELDDWEKLLNEDYELPASISAFDEIVEITTTERDDDRSSSRSAGMSVDSENLLSLSTKNVDKSVEDELSSASELGICSNTGSLTDSVYDKFNQLLREVNDVPFVECTNQLSKYPTEELTMITNNLGGNETNRSISGNTPDENIPGDTLSSLSTARVEEPIEGAIEPEDNVSHVLEYRTKIVSPITNLHSQDTMKNQPEAHYQNSTVRYRHGEAKNEARSTGGIETRPESEIVDDQTSGLYREGEKIEDERACNEEECAFKETSMHPFRKLCHVTNSLTIYDIVLCSFFLTLLITIIVAH